MEFDLKIKYRQEQKLAMTEQMKMSINILQMSSYDLREYIEKEYEENPIIECKFNEENVVYQEAVERHSGSYEDGKYKGSSESSDENKIIAWRDKTLKEFLYEQMGELNLETNVERVVIYMIESLDEKGYLIESEKQIADILNIPIEIVNKALQVVQKFEPKGIGARNLKECLKLQAEEVIFQDRRFKSLLYNIIDNFLEEIAERKIKYIALKLKVTVEEIMECCAVLCNLEPKPASGFYSGDDIKYIIPDAEIRKEDNDYIVIMNDSIIPKVTLNTNLIQSCATSNKDLDLYIKENNKKALFLIKSIEDRKNTMLKILEKLIIKQRDFLEGGKKYIKPLTLKEIAEEINVHESTVSRAIKDKYIRTSYGTIKIKDLFSTVKFEGNGEQNTVGDFYIKDLIKNIIASEDKKKPYSDQLISDKLKQNTVNISRRTVAKYREEMGIKPSGKRKEILQNKKNI